MQTESRPKLSEVMDSIESLIDFWGMPEIIEQLILVCDNKADHLRSNWQDERGAKNWESKAKVLMKTERQISKLN